MTHLHKVFYVPTVDEVLARCNVRGYDIPNSVQLLEWNGCAIPADDLRAALEEAYDPSMPSWPFMVEINA